MDLNKLEELARAATPGPWYGSFDGVRTVPEGSEATILYPRICGVMSTRGRNEPEHANAMFIAAANPVAVLELIDLIRKQEARIEELTMVTGDQHTRLDAVLLVQAGLVVKIDAALKSAEIGQGSYGKNYDGNKLAESIRAIFASAGAAL